MMKQIITRKCFALLSAILFVPLLLAAAESSSNDPWLWLEEIDGINALAWVEGQNQRTAEQLKPKPEFEALYKDALTVLNSESRIPSVEQRGKWLYNLWYGENHPRGIYRRTTLDEFRKADPEWQSVLDIDELSKNKGKPYLFQFMRCLPDENRNCLAFLSIGGTDAAEIREFDMETMSFVRDGFFLPASKSDAIWFDKDTLLLSSATEENSTTRSGSPRILKMWKRGTPISQAKTLFETNVQSNGVFASRIRSGNGYIDIISESLTTWSTAYYQLIDGKLQKLAIPETATIHGAYLGKLILYLNNDWKFQNRSFAAGSVIAAAPETLRGGAGEVLLVAASTSSEIISDVAASDHGILVVILEQVKGRLYRYEFLNEKWERRSIPFPDHGAITIFHDEDDEGNFFVHFESFIIPPALYYVRSKSLKPELMKSQDPTFDGTKFKVEQFWAVSADGTKVPYFAVMSKNIKFDGKNPTHIFSYGGFRIPLIPSYSGSYEQLSGAYGKLWLERGGVFVLANIRGGGEFGPAWHDQAVRENRPKAFEDFEAVVRDLLHRKITSREHLAIEGRSNGGLLVMSLMIRNPELYGAIICGSPVIDMYRYHKLLAGPYWMDEYGDPDNPQDLAFIKTYSPYQNLKSGAKYPPVFFYASTRDDRVHPGHARKMVAKMIENGNDVWYYENVEGGHHASSTNEQLAYRLALAYTHLWEHVGRSAQAKKSAK